MADAQKRAQVATMLEQRRQELGARADVSQRLRQLSASGNRLPAPPSRSPKRSTLLTVIVAAAAVAGLLVIATVATAAVASGFWVQNQLSSPTTTVEDYYAAVHQQDYQTAYTKFSATAQSALTETKYERDMRASDLIAGGVVSYSVSSATINGATATVMVDVVRNSDTTTARVFKVILTQQQQQQTWRISSIQQTGQTAAPTPAS